MSTQMSALFEIEVVNRKYKLVGMSITANFPSSFPEVAIKIQRDAKRTVKV